MRIGPFLSLSVDLDSSLLGAPLGSVRWVVDVVVHFYEFSVVVGPLFTSDLRLYVTRTDPVRHEVFKTSSIF